MYIMYIHIDYIYIYNHTIYIYGMYIPFSYYINETPHTGCIPMLVSYTGGIVIFHYFSYISYILYYYTICASYIIV